MQAARAVNCIRAANRRPTIEGADDTASLGPDLTAIANTAAVATRTGMRQIRRGNPGEPVPILVSEAMTDQLLNSQDNPAAQSAAARRMARLRERRRQGLGCLTILLREAQVDVLIRRGRLSSRDRADAAAIRKAIHGVLDDHL